MNEAGKYWKTMSRVGFGATLPSGLRLVVSCIVLPIICVSCRIQPASKDDPKVVAEVHEQIKHFDEEPFILHWNYTPAVEKLIELGMPSLRHGVLELLLSPNRDTRQRAATVLVAVTMYRMGWRPISTWPNEESRRAYENLMKANGSYSVDDPESLRRASYKKWKKWVAHEKDN